MSRIFVILVLLIVAGYGAISFYYGSPEPCRMLAQHRVNEAADAMGLEHDTLDDSLVESMGRASTSGMTTRECVDDLWREWFD